VSRLNPPHEQLRGIPVSDTARTPASARGGIGPEKTVRSMRHIAEGTARSRSAPKRSARLAARCGDTSTNKT